MRREEGELVFHLAAAAVSFAEVGFLAAFALAIWMNDVRYGIAITAGVGIVMLVGATVYHLAAAKRHAQKMREMRINAEK